MDSIGGETLQAMKTEWQRMVRNNDFYLSDISDYVSVAMDMFARVSEYISTS